MAVIKVKPTSPGRRAVVKVVHKHLHKGAPEASLLEPQKQNSGRNNNGHITMRHKGGGHKHHYRVVDEFKVDAPKTKLLAAKLKAMGLDSVMVIADAVDENLALASRNLANVLIVEPRYADPLSLVFYKKELVTKGAIEQLKEMYA